VTPKMPAPAVRNERLRASASQYESVRYEPVMLSAMLAPRPHPPEEPISLDDDACKLELG
jgi:hypothetical protein